MPVAMPAIEVPMIALKLFTHSCFKHFENCNWNTKKERMVKDAESNVLLLTTTKTMTQATETTMAKMTWRNTFKLNEKMPWYIILFDRSDLMLLYKPWLRNFIRPTFAIDPTNPWFDPLFSAHPPKSKPSAATGTDPV